MTVEKIYTNVFTEKYRCKCGGEFHAHAFDTFPLDQMDVKYVHQCDKCGDSIELATIYPRVIFEQHDGVVM
jgi:hypothetical protein